VVRDVAFNVFECVRNSEVLLPLVTGAAGWVLVRATRGIGFRSKPVRWPFWRKASTRRAGRRIVIPTGVPRRHRRPETIGGIKQW
jgi:hypothetical protein